MLLDRLLGLGSAVLAVIGCCVGGEASGVFFIAAVIPLLALVWRHQDGPGDNSGGGAPGVPGSDGGHHHGWFDGGGFHGGGGGGGGGHGGH